MNIKLKIIITTIMLLSSFTRVLLPDTDISLNELKKIAILEDGRKKPIDTFARNILKQLSGKSKLNRKPAITWLVKLLFTPEKSHDDKIFLINNPEILTSIGADSEIGRGRYSYKQLSNGLSKLRELAIVASRIKRDKRSIVESEIISLYNKIYLFHEISDSFKFCLPQKDFSRINNETLKKFSIVPDPFGNSFLDLLPISKTGKTIESKSLDSLTDSEKEILNISNRMEQWANHYQNEKLKILPYLSSGEEIWESPWESVIKSFKLGKTPVSAISIINKIVHSFRKKDQVGFDNSIKEFNKLVILNSKDLVSSTKINMEIMYNRISPFYKSEFFYGFSLLFLLLSFIKFKKQLYYLSYFLLILGLIPHTYGIIARMIIRNRPPVTNLFETFVFAAWITVILGLSLELFKKRNIGILTGSLSGLLLLIISGRYALDGDTMGMLVAVLDSNFWLATHVITITIGYGGIVISGVLGHLYLFQAIFYKQKRNEILKDTFQSIYATQAFGLIFTFVGTVLGGIWADQSWGRFWGWDPKENGALLIILWSSILFHAKLGKMIKELGFSLGSIVGIISVVLAWFGVNLLGVGLHNYGFSSNVANALIVYIIIESLIITGSYIYLRQKKI